MSETTIPTPPLPTAPTKEKRSRSGALLVGAGIFLSRVLGLVRTRFLAAVLGQSIAADAFRTISR